MGRGLFWETSRNVSVIHQPFSNTRQPFFHTKQIHRPFWAHSGIFQNFLLTVATAKSLRGVWAHPLPSLPHNSQYKFSVACDNCGSQKPARRLSASPSLPHSQLFLSGRFSEISGNYFFQSIRNFVYSKNRISQNFLENSKNRIFDWKKNLIFRPAEGLAGATATKKGASPCVRQHSFASAS